MPDAISVCSSCGAVDFGNLTCRACRAEMRKQMPDSKLLQLLDDANVETISVVGADAVRAFVQKLEARRG